MTARPTAAGAQVRWRAAVAPTGRTLVSYVIRATGGTLVTVGASTTTANVTGLSVGHWYAFTVTSVYDDASRITSIASKRVASPVITGWSTKVTGGRAGQVLSDVVAVRPSGAWTLASSAGTPATSTWRSVTRVTTSASGKAKVKLHLVGGSWQWRLTVVGPARPRSRHQHLPALGSTAGHRWKPGLRLGGHRRS